MSEENKTTFEHIALMQEEQIKFGDLPEIIRDKIREFKLLVRDYNEGEKTPEDLKVLTKADVKICHLIQDWLEEDEEEEEEEKPKAEPKKDEPKADTTDTKTDDKDKKDDEPKIDSLEVEVRKNLNGNKINQKVLAKIIGRDPHYPVEKVGELTLRKKLFYYNEYEVEQ